MKTQIIKRYWNEKESGTMKPPIKIVPCTCGQMPSYYSSAGGFNYYGYYKCDKCNIFATGSHQFPTQIIDIAGKNENKSPKLFVVYDDETNPENGWNNLLREV